MGESLHHVEANFDVGRGVTLLRHVVAVFDAQWGISVLRVGWLQNPRINGFYSDEEDEEITVQGYQRKLSLVVELDFSNHHRSLIRFGRTKSSQDLLPDPCVDKTKCHCSLLLSSSRNSSRRPSHIPKPSYHPCSLTELSLHPLLRPKRHHQPLQRHILLTSSSTSWLVDSSSNDFSAHNATIVSHQ